MYKFTVFAFVAFIVLQVALTKPAENNDITLDKLMKDTEALINSASQALGFKNIDDANKQVTDQLKKNAKDLETKLSAAVEGLKTEAAAHKPEIDNKIKEVQATLSKTVASLQKSVGPETTAKAKQLKTQLDEGLKESMAQVQKLIKAVEPDATKVKTQVEATAKSLLEQLSEISKNVESQWKSSVQDHEKTHKH